MWLFFQIHLKRYPPNLCNGGGTGTVPPPTKNRDNFFLREYFLLKFSGQSWMRKRRLIPGSFCETRKFEGWDPRFSTHGGQILTIYHWKCLRIRLGWLWMVTDPFGSQNAYTIPETLFLTLYYHFGTVCGVIPAPGTPNPQNRLWP